jgi:cysteinyl-tRNA synthetase
MEVFVMYDTICKFSTFNLYNSMTNQKEPFKARKDKMVKIFTCGPSVYQKAHIGNYRTYLFEDLLVRYLEHLGYKVERVLNFTDVEDKAVEAAQNKDENIGQLTSKIADKFNEEANLLRIKPPTHNPRSSENVDQAVKLIKELLKKGIAYWHQGDVYYDPLKFNGFGKLYGLDMSLWPKKKKRFKKDTYTGMRWNLGDFILWHGCREGENVCFDDQLGTGRPSWNVQDPAMATKYLGFQIDICCGGVDNLYRHHDYNIAVVEGVSGETFANYWLHSAHLFVYGQKMSKSIGNIIYLEDILKDGFKPEHIRFFLIYTKHYREKLNFTRQQFLKAAERLDKFNEQVQEIIDSSTCHNKPQVEPLVKELIFGLVHSFNECMNNDLDVRCAFDDLNETLRKLLEYKKDGRIGKRDCKALAKGLKEIDSVLQIIYK